MMQSKPHTVVTVVDRWGDMRLGLSCPYEPDDPYRPCPLGVEPTEPCLWQTWENGEHHPDCPRIECDTHRCWPGEPEECDGFPTDIGHCHPAPGCAASELIGELGWEDAVHVSGLEGVVGTPMDVEVFSDDIDGVELRPWSAGGVL